MTINWEWLETMVAGVAKSMPDGDEYQSFAMAWIYQQLEQYLRTHTNPPNFRNLVSWSLGHYLRNKRLHHQEDNFEDGNGFEIRDERIDPADQVAIRLDTKEFLEKLNENQKTVLTMTLEGFSGKEIAAVLQRAPGRISQIKGEIRDKATVHLIEYY